MHVYFPCNMQLLDLSLVYIWHGVVGYAQYNVLVWHGIAWKCIVQYGIVRCSMVLYVMLWNGFELYGMVQCGAVWCGVVWCGLVCFSMHFYMIDYIYTPLCAYAHTQIYHIFVYLSIYIYYIWRRAFNDPGFVKLNKSYVEKENG